MGPTALFVSEVSETRIRYRCQVTTRGHPSDKATVHEIPGNRRCEGGMGGRECLHELDDLSDGVEPPESRS
jgi:hypothetical protein